MVALDSVNDLRKNHNSMAFRIAKLEHFLFWLEKNNKISNLDKLRKEYDEANKN